MFTRQTREEIELIAEERGWDPAALLAIAEVESAGRAYWTVRGQRLPAIRHEGHYFYKRLKGARLKRAVREGLAHPRAGAVKMPRSWAARYDLHERAKAIDESAAIESISIGLGQVMGAWWKRLGYNSPQHMFEVAKASVAGQVELMARYITEFGLGQYVANPSKRGFAHFAKGYNGKGYRKNRYDTKMWSAYRRWSKGSSTTKVATESKREWLLEIQGDLHSLGYNPGPKDGVMGKSTREAIKAFQRDNGLVVDGQPGPMTREAMNERLNHKSRETGKRRVKQSLGVLGGSVASEAGTKILEKTGDIQALGISSIVMDLIVVGLTIGGVALLGWGLYKQFTAEDE